MDLIATSPFYRVTAKAIILNDENKLLVIRNHNGNLELPGGGWEHDETFEDCLKREIYEEIGVGTMSVGEVIFMYRGRNTRKGFMTLRLAARVQLHSHDFIVGDDIGVTMFVTKAAFRQLDFMAAEGDVHEYESKIWPSVDKTISNL